MSTQLDIALTGHIYYPGDEGFETARVGRIFNGRRPERRPVAVLVARTEDDVAYGVRLAKANGWSVAVRSGGHSWAAWSVQDGTLLIDLGELQGMGYDEATGIVWANPAVKGGDTLSPWLESRGRFFNGGHCPSVGIGGFLLQGGQGWCQRGWGWAAESIVGIDVVTADGKRIYANEQENADLYWAARGAGPSFPGIVTRFHLQTRPMFGFLGHSVQVYDLQDYGEVMAWMYGIHQTVSPDVEIVIVSTTLPAGPGEDPVRRLLVTGVALTDTEEQAREALAPFNTCPVLDRALVVQDCRASTLAEQRREQERQNPEHVRYRVDSLWAEGEPGKVIELIKPMFTDLPTPGSFTIWFSNGPVRELPDMAFSLQTEAYVATYIVYDDPEQDDRYQDLLNRLTARAEPITAGQYLGDSDMTNRQVKFMADENFARLQNIIARRDPDARFVRYLAQDQKTINRNHWEL
jgi:FAD/FMN-containing dehydrogenase